MFTGRGPRGVDVRFRLVCGDGTANADFGEIPLQNTSAGSTEVAMERGFFRQILSGIFNRVN